MKAMGFACLVTVFAALGPAALAQPAALDFQDAKWIWFSAGAEVPLGSLPAAANFFRSKLTIPDSAQVERAEVIATCDNLFILHLNGRCVGESGADNSAWNKPRRWDVTGWMQPGQNVVAIEAINTLPGPAGMICKLVVQLKGGEQLALVSDGSWMATGTEHPSWQAPDFDDSHWNEARVMGEYGVSPWNTVKIPAAAAPAGTPTGPVRAYAKESLEKAAKQGQAIILAEAEPAPDFVWPESVIFVGDDCSLYRPLAPTASSMDSLSVTIFNPRKSRAFPEHDLPAPMKVGRRLYAITPARPGVKPRVLLDAGRGGLGSPSVSFAGDAIYLSMAYDGEPFFHIYRLPAQGGRPQRLTDGPFHDVDPVELPDGRIVFTSTRIGTFEEYHNPPSRSLFIMAADGSELKPLTHTIIFDNEPEVLPDGRILFIRSDNFFDRGKVETLLHAIHTDGSLGYTEFGLDIGPDYGGRLRSYYCGSPAPMPDGRVAFVSQPGITVGRMGAPEKYLQHFRVEAGDVNVLPDGRLLCTLPRRREVEITKGGKSQTVQDLCYEKIAVIDPDIQQPALNVLYDSDGMPLHSPVFLGQRPRPAVMAETIEASPVPAHQATGVLYCQSVAATKNHTAGWKHVRAIRVLAGTGLTTRSSHSYIVHAGNETVELGVVPLAPDGSFAVEVPADTPIALQAVDAEGRSELNEMSWIYVKPGEQRGCVGCHHTRQAAPMCEPQLPLAMTTTPLKLVGQGQPHRFRGNNAAVTGLMNMQFDRYREVAGINRHTEHPDPLASGRQEVQTLIAQLGGQDGDLKISAANRLSIFRDPAAEPALLASLDDPRREVRVAAAMALGACGTRVSVGPLVAALEDWSPLVAQAAAVSLENLTGCPLEFNGFVTSAERESQAVQWKQWLSTTTWEKLEQDLAARLQTGDRDEARRAAVALGHIGGPASHAALRQYLTTHRDDNPLPAWRAAGHRGDGARFNSLAEVNPRSLQAVTRSIGYLDDEAAVPLLRETLLAHSDPNTGNLFLAEAAAEALGRIGTREAQQALVTAFANLTDYPVFTNWYGDHSALMACHASPVHYYIMEALDSLGSDQAASILPHLIRSVPIDPDRALLLPTDDYEGLVGRVIRRHGCEPQVVETCLALLGDPQATTTKEFEDAIRTIHRCWGGHPCAENRAAQVLSLVCRDAKYEPRVRAAFDRYRALPVEIPRVFDTGIPVVLELPLKNWVCFYLARSLGNLADPRSAEPLTLVLRDSPPEAASGHPDPLGPGCLFLHNDLTPCWRAAVAWALGRIGDPQSTSTLLAVVKDLDNAPDTRHAAATALRAIGDPTALDAIRELAATYPEVSTRKMLFRTLTAPASESKTTIAER